VLGEIAAKAVELEARRLQVSPRPRLVAAIQKGPQCRETFSCGLRAFGLPAGLWIGSARHIAGNRLCDGPRPLGRQVRVDPEPVAVAFTRGAGSRGKKLFLPLGSTRTRKPRKSSSRTS
jgi:hypothetical protein